MTNLVPSAAGIVLCGGRSTRMGQDKAKLMVAGETMLARVVRLLGEVVRPIIVVAAEAQTLPALPANPPVEIAFDRQPHRGPLEGLRAGLALLMNRPEIESAYVTSCDAPLLVPAFVRQMFLQLGDHEIAVPQDGAFYHPLAAVYRPSILSRVEQLLAEDQLRMNRLFDVCSTRSVPVDELRGSDPQLLSLINLNRPADLEEAERRLT